jgi:uncharacterized membrane protein
MDEQMNQAPAVEPASAPAVAPVSSAIETADPADVEKNKVVSALAYLGILFFLPLVTDKDSKFGKFHANQGLILLIVSVASNIILPMIPVIGWIAWPIVSIAVLVFFVMGIMNALNGKMTPLPLIGNFTLIK